MQIPTSKPIDAQQAALDALDSYLALETLHQTAVAQTDEPVEANDSDPQQIDTEANDDGIDGIDDNDNDNDNDRAENARDEDQPFPYLLLPNGKNQPGRLYVNSRDYLSLGARPVNILLILREAWLAQPDEQPEDRGWLNPLRFNEAYTDFLRQLALPTTTRYATDAKKVIQAFLAIVRPDMPTIIGRSEHGFHLTTELRIKDCTKTTPPPPHHEHGEDRQVETEA